MTSYYATRYRPDSGRTAVWKAIAEYLQRYVSETDIFCDIGAGYCDMVNNIRAKERIALDLQPEAAQHIADGVTFYLSSATDMSCIKSNSIDVAFMSNLLEHLDFEQLTLHISELRRVLNGRGKVIIIQPNYRYCCAEYFDDYTHKTIFSHVSLVDFFENNNFATQRVEPRFLPFSMKSRLPKSTWLTRLYLQSPYRPFAKQMLAIFTKR